MAHIMKHLYPHQLYQINEAFNNNNGLHYFLCGNFYHGQYSQPIDSLYAELFWRNTKYLFCNLSPLEKAQ